MKSSIGLAVVFGLLMFGRAFAEESAKKDLVTAGEFTKVYDPSVGEKEKWYINDHCFIYGNDGLWHMFGITREQPAKPREEIKFAHATAKTLLQQPWDKLPFALTVATKEPWNEVHLWAPHVVESDGVYYMFYCAGGENGTKYKLHLATSKDLREWTRHKDNPMVIDGYDARDPYITKVGDKWVMYYTATSKPTGGNHVVVSLTSDDLVHWGNRKIVFTDPSKGKAAGPTESPFVVQRGDSWYMFMGPRDGMKKAYDGTDVYVSKDPFKWNVEDRVGHFAAHAAEVIRDLDGKWYISRAGWNKGGFYLAPLTWCDGLDDKPTNIPVPKATGKK